MKRRIIFIIGLSVLFLLQSGLLAKPKYALGLFHFNLQYVAGDHKIETRIIRESLYPALQFFEQHPKYKSDIEIQGWAIEELAEEHPKVLALLRKLVNRGQIELVVAHYSDEFFIAYPALDLQRSVEISDQVLAKNNLKRSRVFFGQELQWSPGLASALKGKYDVVVTSATPNGYYRGATLPLVKVHYGNDTILGLIGGGKKQLQDFDWDWAFFDDGEVFNSLDYNSDFYRVPEQEKKNADHYKELADKGYTFLTISEFINKVKSAPHYKIPDYPFVPEGTWNMQVGGPYMWMGRQRSGVEKDGLTRAVCYEARGKVLLAEKLIAYAEQAGMDVTGLKKLLQQAWKHVLLAEVSDSSGWSPWLVEVQYTDNEVANTMAILRKIFAALKEHLPSQNQPVVVDTHTGAVNVVDHVKTLNTTPGVLPIFRSVRAKKYTAQIRQIDENLYRLDIHAKRPKDGAVEITFYTAESGLKYSAGCGEQEIVEIPTGLKHDPILALSNGFLYLGNGYSLIKDCSVEHLAATWKEKEGYVVFREELNDKNPGMHMRFYVVKGTPQAGHTLANNLNIWPSYVLRIVDGKVKATKILPGMECE
ncbi:MAG: hypothetical protein GXO75_11260 [Calditrichaeota bacterium]|nr:hypothetical protein [Calditrichota bacterium]